MADEKIFAMNEIVRTNPDMRLSAHTEKILLGLILCLAFLLRMEHINNPVLDWPSMRQGHTALIARNFAENGMNLLIPDIGGNGLEPDVWYNEFSLYPYLVACAYQFTGVDTSIARFINILSSLFCLIQIYRVTRRYCDSRAALFAAAIFAIVPLSIYYGRTVQRQQLVLFFGITMFDEFDKWLMDRRLRRYFIALISGIFALLMNPPIAFMGLPMLFVILKQRGFRGLLDYRVLSLAVLVLLPAALWYKFALHHPNSWSLHRSNLENFRTYGDPLYYIEWMKPYFFPKVTSIFWTEVLTPPGTILAYASLALLWKHLPKVFYVWALAVLVYFTLDVHPIAIGVHSYYYLNAVPILCIFSGVTLGLFWDRKASFMRDMDPRILRLVILVVLAVILAMGWHTNQKRYVIPWGFRDVEEAAKAVQIMIPEDALLFVDKFDPAPFYMMHRKGWYQESTDVDANYFEGIRAKGCEYLLFFNLANTWDKPGMVEYQKSQMETLYQKPGYRILKFR